MTTNNKICSDPAYLNAIDQKLRMAFLNIPPPRYDNLAKNPYTMIDLSTNQYYTQYQLDMRRKIEILKYSSVRMSTQTNGLTKSQKYAQLVNGTYQQRTYPKSYLNKIIEDISNGIPVLPCIEPPTSSTACDIPGPVIQLVEDNNVPLYNLINTASYGIINEEITGDIWNYTKLQNIPLIDAKFVTVTSLYIIKTNFNTDVFSLSIPISANISAKTINNISYNYQSDFSFSIVNAQANILYSYSDVTLKEKPVYTLNSYSIPSIPIDLSINMILDTSFNINVYLGELSIDNIHLYTQTGYIYDIQLQLDYLIVTEKNFESVFQDPNIVLIANSTNSLGDTFMITSINGGPT
jgi:hypothetical protein